MKQKTNRKRINITIDAAKLTQLRRIQAEHGVPISQSIDLALRRYLNGYK